MRLIDWKVLPKWQFYPNLYIDSIQSKSKFLFRNQQAYYKININAKDLEQKIVLKEKFGRLNLTTVLI